MNKAHVKIDKDLYLISQKINDNVITNIPKQVNHIFVIDVSGSMWDDLPLIRTQLKNKLSTTIREGDTISIIWFSGRNDAGILKEEVEVRSLKTLSDLNEAIDRWLQPIGLTAFLKPLQLVKELIERIKKNRPDGIFSLIFQTDGWNNDCNFNDAINVLTEISGNLSAASFIEYGLYCDSQKLTKMASISGGEKISCNGFDEFEPVLDKKLSSVINGGKKIVVEIKDDYLYDFAFSVGNDGVLLYNISDGKIMVNSDVSEVHYFSGCEVGIHNNSSETALYAGIYVLADRLLNDNAEKIFYTLGDTYHYKELANAFGKQRLNAFKSAIKECIVDSTKRFPEGKNEIQPVDDNAYCLMNLVNDLALIPNCLFYPNHDDFNYKRIGAKRKAKGSELSENDKKRLAEAKNVEEANQILNEFKEKNIDLVFVESNPNKGYPLTNLVWNEERANLSIQIRKEGTIELPENRFKLNMVSSFVYRTYTLIKDGIINFQKLPVSYSDELSDLLVKNNVKFEYSSILDTETLETKRYLIIDLMSLPVINRSMIKSISAIDLAKQEWELMKLKADNKVYKYFREQYFPKTSKSFVDEFGQECTDWLKEIGITDYNGFAPKTIAEESKDFYMSVNLATKIKGLSTLPAVKNVIAKIESGKTLTLNEWIMQDSIIKFNDQLNSDIYKSLSEDQQLNMLEMYLNNKTKELNESKWKAIQAIAQFIFSLILSKRWFNEFKSFDENTLSLVLDGKTLNFTFDMSEKEVAI